MTTVVCRYEIHQFEVMLFGLMKVLWTSQRMMDRLLGGLLLEKSHVDDVLIFSPTIKELVHQTKEVITLAAEHDLNFNLSKCNFVKEEIALLGHFVDSNDVRVDSKKIKVIQQVKEDSSKVCFGQCWFLPPVHKVLCKYLCTYDRRSIAESQIRVNYRN